MIKVFPFGRFILQSPFLRDWEGKEEAQSLLRDEGIFITSDVMSADLIMTSGLDSKRILAKLLAMMLKYGEQKKYLIWTDEPRFDLSFSPVISYPFLPKLHVFNIYTGAYINNYRFLPSTQPLEFLKYFEFSHCKTVAVMLYRNSQREWSLQYQGRELDLCYLRTQIALTGHKMGVCDIYGHGWPNGISIGKSRYGNWVDEKRKILKNYHFNLAFENTNWPNYCTEKIWQAIEFGSLPIYYGQGNAIYEDFQQESFIDYCQFENPQDLFRFIQSMTPQEYKQRINLCIEAFNTALLKSEDMGRGMQELMILTAKRIHEIVGR